jgi:uncharacterized OB-fold protein
MDDLTDFEEDYTICENCGEDCSPDELYCEECKEDRRFRHQDGVGDRDYFTEPL